MSTHTETDPTILDSTGKRVIAWSYPANKESVAKVLGAEPGTDDGRSEWRWLRLENGDLMLGVFPRGATYEYVEVDAQLPANITVTEDVSAESVTLVCPNCGDEALASQDQYIGTCRGSYSVLPDGTVQFDAFGHTEINWDSAQECEQPVSCRNCYWQGVTVDLVRQEEEPEDEEDDEEPCEDCSVNGLDCAEHGQAARLALAAITADPIRVMESLAWARE